LATGALCPFLLLVCVVLDAAEALVFEGTPLLGADVAVLLAVDTGGFLLEDPAAAVDFEPVDLRVDVLTAECDAPVEVAFLEVSAAAPAANSAHALNHVLNNALNHVLNNDAILSRFIGCVWRFNSGLYLLAMATQLLAGQAAR
jgi:hypothetical protein